MSTEKPRVIVTLPNDLFKRIEDFRYENRYPNRSEAVLALIEAGLKKFKENSTTTEHQR